MMTPQSHLEPRSSRNASGNVSRTSSPSADAQASPGRGVREQGAAAGAAPLERVAPITPARVSHVARIMEVGGLADNRANGKDCQVLPLVLELSRAPLPQHWRARDLACQGCAARICPHGDG